MQITIEGTPKEINELLQTIASSQEQKKSGYGESVNEVADRLRKLDEFSKPYLDALKGS